MVSRRRWTFWGLPGIEEWNVRAGRYAQAGSCSDTTALKISQLKTFRDVGTRFRENWKGYVHKYRVLLVLAFLASLADMASTIYIMLIHGPTAEGHPIVRAISFVFGPILGPLLGKAAQFLVAIGVTVFLRRWAVYILVPLIILYGWAAWYNLWGYEVYYPRLLEILERLGI